MTNQIKKGRGRPKKDNQKNSYLLEPLKLAELVQKGNKDHFHKFCIIENGRLTASNGEVTISIPLLHEFNFNPKTSRLIKVLNSLKVEFSISLSNDAIKINTSDEIILVESLRDNEKKEIDLLTPDESSLYVDDRLIESFRQVFHLCSETIEVPALNGVLVSNGSCVASNSTALMESWHGFVTPPILISKETSKIISKIDKDLKSLGFSQDTLTFYFEDGTYLVCKNLKHNYPDYNNMFNNSASIPLQPIPHSFEHSLKIIKNSKISDLVYFHDGKMSSHPQGEREQFYTYLTLNFENMIFKLSDLISVSAAFERIGFDLVSNCALFYGDRVRAIVKGATPAVNYDIQSYLEQQEIQFKDPEVLKEDENFFNRQEEMYQQQEQYNNYENPSF